MARVRKLGLAASALALLAGALLLCLPAMRRRDAAPSIVEGFEARDMQAGMVVKVLGACFGIVIACVALLFVMIHFFHRNDLQTPLTAQQAVVIQPPAPNLQSDPDRELRELRAREHARIEEYAWDDPGHVRARIPIARAMELVTGRSLEPSP